MMYAYGYLKVEGKPRPAGAERGFMTTCRNKISGWSRAAAGRHRYAFASCTARARNGATAHRRADVRAALMPVATTSNSAASIDQSARRPIKAW